MRAGNPWVRVRGPPFMPIAIIASRPSRATESGVEIVMPSTSVERIWSALVESMPALASTSASGMPSHRADPMYGPPTSFDTQVRVMSRSIVGIAASSSKVKVTSWSTSPSMVSVHESTSTVGRLRRVSTR